jgi:hypothetical protein
MLWLGEGDGKGRATLVSEFSCCSKFSLLAHLIQNCVFAMFCLISTYDHRSVRTGHPVRSAIHKH